MIYSNGLSYRDNVLRNCPNFDKEDLFQKLSLSGLGIAGESGEVVDLIKKFLHHDKPLDKTKLIKEMGDIHWYLEYLAITIGVTEYEVKQANVTKLLERYPNGFNFTDANKPREE
jgi:NTP pyrophosphatase (non-canonical NTP hydrolase)